MKIGVIQQISERVKWGNQEVGAENNTKSGSVLVHRIAHTELFPCLR